MSGARECSHHYQHSATHGPPALVSLALAGGYRAGRYLAARWTRSIHRGLAGSMLTHPSTLHLRESEVGLTASAYLAGSVLGALVFSYLTDRQGRKKWFMITLLLYLTATVCTAFSCNLASFMVFRFLTGAGIGGEYAAINSAIDEKLIPARRRGHTDLAINGTWWLGSAAGALMTLLLLNPAYSSRNISAGDCVSCLVRSSVSRLR